MSTPTSRPSSPSNISQRIGNVPVHRRGKLVWFVAGMSVDADGSPRAYHPSSSRGLDFLANAGQPGHWWALACDPQGQPYVQGTHDPVPGYYVSTTALQDSGKAVNDCHRYVDSESIPYIVLPRGFGEGVRLGDFALVLNPRTGCQTPAIYADIGPRGHLGEGSIALARALGIDPNPRRGGCKDGIQYLVFPGSGNGRPQACAEIERQVKELTTGYGITESAAVFSDVVESRSGAGG